MSGKPKKKDGGRASQTADSPRRGGDKTSGMRYFPLAIGVLVALGLGGAYFFSRSGPAEAPLAGQVQGPHSSAIGGETRPTLDPTQFTGKISQAYQVAREIPQVLDQIYCYCECQENYGHKSLLSCYVDLHAVGCDVCLDEALLASSYNNKEGYSIAEIREKLDQRYGKRG